ncbi:zinc-ribbon domain containing protein [Candidatus Falkowbacteria bacterium]|nr:zinc-ribbon domain containing protein [Candidatus Falkowbacteria bacterium]
MPTCKQCTTDFPITDADKTFYAKISVPEPTRCPDCRQQRRLSWVNEMNLYPRQCDLSGKNIISSCRPDSGLIIYDTHRWWGDGWEGLNFGVEYNEGQKFFDQFFALHKTVPHPALNVTYGTLIDSEYVNYCGHTKSSYLIFDSDYDEDCYYCYSVNNSKDLVDCLKMQRSELCYSCIDCDECFNLFYSQDCLRCSESYWLKNCYNCVNCFGCVNARNQKYCWFNEQLTPEEYQRRLAGATISSRQAVRQWQTKYADFRLQYPCIYQHGIKNDGCTGDYLKNTNQVADSYDCWEAQNCRYCYAIYFSSKDMYDVFQWGNCQLMYEGVVVGENDYNCKFCFQCYNSCQNLEYCFESHGCKNCFGCVGLKKKEFCILNKQYTEPEYLRLREQIIQKMKADGEYGEFFPAAYSPFGYNETTARFYYPLSREQALERGWRWFDQEEKNVDHKAPPDDLGMVTEDILRETYVCACGKSFKIIPQEWKFYQNLKIPLPDQCYICRHQDRLRQRNPQHLWPRQCAKCQKDMQTTYAPDRPEIVYCRECFREAVY